MRKRTLFAALALLALLTVPAGATDSIDPETGLPVTVTEAPIFAPTETVTEIPAAVPEYHAAAAAPSNLKATLSTSNVAVDGFQVWPEGYCINQENYYKLRDIAYMLIGKGTAFDVVWDDQYQCVSMITGRNYTIAGGEMQVSGSAQITKLVPAYSEVRLNGQLVQMTGYNINNNNYYRIRDVAPLIGFGIDWDSATSTVVIDSKTVVEQPEESVPVFGEEPDGNETSGSDPEEETGPVESEYPWIGPKIDGVLTILLDAGHGGSDPGSYNETTKQDENHTNLTVAEYLRDMLEAEGVQVIMSRESVDTNLYGTDRKNYVRSVCEQGEIDLVLSIHHNGATGHKARGTEVYAQRAGLSPEAGINGNIDPSITSQALGAMILQNYLDMDIGLANRGLKTDNNLYMVITSGDYGIPAVLSEFCFIDNAEDVKFIDEPHELEAEAKAIFDALMAFYETTPY